jgi:ATP-dependent Lhr-like helicase
VSPGKSEAPFAPAVREWFAEAFEAPTRAQRLGWAAIAKGESALVFAPTGSGKTLAAFLAAIDRVMLSPVPPTAERCRVVYVSPLKALAVDVERTLRAPLHGIARVAARRGETVHVPEVAIRTGDTPQSERASMLRRPPDILITTPESLFLLLTSRARAILAGVDTVIVDEIHAMVGTKRGAHLALSLERLAEVARKPPQRIGLSATQRPLEEVARFLGGGEGLRNWKPRPVTIVDAGAKKAFDLRVEVPVEDMSRLGETMAPSPDVIPEGSASSLVRRSIWPAVHPRLLELVRAHRSTIVFVNSRRLAERLAAALNELGGGDVARAHHGSIAREQRIEIEDALKSGRLPAIVATSSLELGIDMGAVDLVVQIETPTSVASGMQRIGRASHQVDAVSRGVIFPKYRGDLLASAAITKAMKEGAVEETRVPRNPLDVLAQHLVAAVALGERRVDDLFALVRGAAPYAQLSRASFEGTLDMLAGRYPSDEFAELRPRVVWDRLRGTVRSREGAQRLVVANAGTIPDRGLYGVFLADGAGGGRRVGELDEEMVFESRVGEVFVLGASSWRIAEITRDRVLVVPAPGEPGKMPFWKADRGARPLELGRRIGRLTREIGHAPREDARRRLQEEHDLDPLAAQNLVAYLEEQKEATGALPDDRTLVLERTRDEMGDWRLCLLSPWGGRVHAPWAMALEARLRKSGEAEVETVWTDDGIVVRLPERDRPPEAADLLPEPEEIEDLVTGELSGSSLFAARFREAAARALLLPRRRPGQRTPLWMQRKRAHDLLQVASRHPSFPIVLEAFRECLQDVFDLPGLVDLARRVRQREIRLVTADTQAPSPFSASLLFGYVANYLYEGDAPLAERRAQALSVDQSQLRDLLGEAQLRELLDAHLLAELEMALQGLTGYRANGPDRLHELLVRLGDLSVDEVEARVDPGEGGDAAARAREWLALLVRERRAIEVRVAGDERFAAAEEAGRFRDALGMAPPRGLPDAFLDEAPHALRELVARYARTHGPFTPRDVAARFGMGEGPIMAALAELGGEGRVLEGGFRPGGAGREWCSADVLATLRRRSLAALRRQVEPAEPEALARTLVEWHGVVPAGRAAVAPRRGPDALLDVVEQLQGASVPASILERDVLRARLPTYRPEDLDTLCAAGEIVWAGLGPLGDRDGRVALFLTDDLPLLLPLRPEPPPGALHQALREHLTRHGASFFGELAEAAGGGLPQAIVDALWDLAWAGEVTSDTPGALRAFLARHAPRAERVRRAGPFRSRRQVPPSAAGRWSRLPLPRKAPSPTERAKALAEQLLARHGVLTRDAVASEDVAGGYSAVYPVLRALEEQGRVRRGYFVAGLGGLQFADPGALDRLRARRERDSGEPVSVVLAAADPANPYGAALPWPKRDDARLQRAAGSHVVLVDGALAAFLGRGTREVVPLLPQDEPLRSRVGEATARALADWCARTGRAALGWSPEAAPRLAEGPLAAFLAAAGFERSGPGYRLAPARAAVSMADAGALEAAADALGVQDAPDPGED